MNYLSIVNGSFLLSSLVLDDLSDELSKIPFCQGLAMVLKMQSKFIRPMKH